MIERMIIDGYELAINMQKYIWAKVKLECEIHRQHTHNTLRTQHTYSHIE